MRRLAYILFFICLGPVSLWRGWRVLRAQDRLSAQATARREAERLERLRSPAEYPPAPN